jgi:hypothetical protein
MKLNSIAALVVLWSLAGAAAAVGNIADVTIHYDTFNNLVAMGVIRAPRIATPFPGQFVPDPR